MLADVRYLTASNRDNVMEDTVKTGAYQRAALALRRALLLADVPHGDAGWTIDARSNGRRSTTMNWYSYRLMSRDVGHDLHLCGRLFQQYIVDTYAKMEQGSL